MQRGTCPPTLTWPLAGGWASRAGEALWSSRAPEEGRAGAAAPLLRTTSLSLSFNCHFPHGATLTLLTWRGSGIDPSQTWLWGSDARLAPSLEPCRNRRLGVWRGTGPGHCSIVMDAWLVVTREGRAGARLFSCLESLGPAQVTPTISPPVLALSLPLSQAAGLLLSLTARSVWESGSLARGWPGPTAQTGTL